MNPTTQPILSTLHAIQSQSIQWLWPGRIPCGKLTMVVGDTCVGKSFWTLDLAARISTGSPWPDQPDQTRPPAGVILWNTEDDLADTIRPRLEAARADLSRINAITAIRHLDSDSNVVNETPFNLADDLSALETAILSTPDCRLLIVDPITACLGAGVNADIRQRLAPLAALAAKHSIAIVCISHLNKSQAAPALYRPTGSHAFLAASRSAWVIHRDPNDPTARRRLFLPLKNNIQRDDTGLAFELHHALDAMPTLVWESAPFAIPASRTLARSATRGPEPLEQNRAKKWLLAHLANGPRPAKLIEADARDEEGITHATLRRARVDLGIKSFRFKNQGILTGLHTGYWYWRLPLQPQPAHPAPEFTDPLAGLFPDLEEPIFPDHSSKDQISKKFEPLESLEPLPLS